MRIFASFCPLVFKKKSSEIFSISGVNLKTDFIIRITTKTALLDTI